MGSWKTYTPDGRMLAVECAEGSWTAVCEGAVGTGTSALEAITGAVGSRGASIGATESTTEAWIAAQAAQLEAEES